ncbi:MAG: aminotransferase class V-fold PLP-dependent enzyme [Candidatus Eisenbacteria bacterium]|uniref:Aminotransferase class V-fold PLP-dependent enzyme n=1 Tax=Eiseniibacteriota bacterium TaxID=2212470 RepID=A0A956RMT0_UNCEI|nr:aminotransferase class V-fold PLP-dependent enzyme [Candidatus Eisenbacteria bacterium]
MNPESPTPDRPPISAAFRSRIRSAFPALASSTVFLENAGGSQLPAVVIESMREYMRDRYVQLGAGYRRSREATETVAEAHRFAALLFGADVEDAAASRPGEDAVILGPSTTALLRNLAEAYADVISPGREIVIAETNHEANIGPWLRLERQGTTVRWWRPQLDYRMDPDDLSELLTPKTALVVVPHVSNLLGEILDLREVVRRAHAAGARVVADGVAYAPHRVLDVSEWDVDWYVYSTYKVYGPHLAALYGKGSAIRELRGPNHFFIPASEIPYKFEPGGVAHEAGAGLLALGAYLHEVADAWSQEVARRAEPEAMGREPHTPEGAPRSEKAALDRATVRVAFEAMTECEQEPQRRIVQFLADREEWEIVGSGLDRPRVPTVSFRHRRRTAAEVVGHFDAADVAIRHGHMYAYRLCERLGFDPVDGVIRVSLVHYNTPEEADRVVDLLGGM